MGLSAAQSRKYVVISKAVFDTRTHTLCNIFVRSCRLGFYVTLRYFTQVGYIYNITHDHIIFYIKNVKASVFHFNMQ